MSVEVRNLVSTYSENSPFEKTALKNINFKIEDGEYVGIIGHTGSGKSTLIQHFNSLIKPSSGEVLVDGVNINESKENLIDVRKKVGVVFQYPEHQLFELTVLDDVQFGAKNMGFSEEEAIQQSKKALSIVGIGEKFYSKSPFELSGGQKRKVAIAGILAMQPRILVLDEPTAGLDPKSRDELFENINKMRKELNLTVILVSHSMEDISKYVDRIIVLHESELKYFGTPEEVFKNEKELVKIGLSVPQVTTLINKLNENGYNIDRNIFTVDKLVEELKKAKGVI